MLKLQYSRLLRRRDCWMVWRCHDIPCVNFCFLFRINVRKKHLDESDWHHYYGNFFESIILKVNWSQLIEGSFSIIERYIDNSILKDTLQLKILRTWTKIGANSSIKTSVNIIKQKSTKVPSKLSLTKKNGTPHTLKIITPK